MKITATRSASPMTYQANIGMEVDILAEKAREAAAEKAANRRGTFHEESLHIAHSTFKGPSGALETLITVTVSGTVLKD